MPSGPGSQTPNPFQYYYYYYAQEIVVQGHTYTFLALHAGICVRGTTMYGERLPSLSFIISLKNEQ